MSPAQPSPPWSQSFAGRFEEHRFESELLRDNPLGDPAARPLYVYLPPGYDEDPERRFPAIYVIQGLTGQLDMWKNRPAFQPTGLEALAATFSGEEAAPPCVVVLVDCWTSLGGSQFLDSPGTGRYHSYLCDEVLPWIDARYRTLPAPANRGIAGKSCGGYGAMVTPLLRPELFGALATHAGDALFEACYQPDFREAARVLRERYAGSFDAFWAAFRSRPAFSVPGDEVLLNAWCMAACYSTDADGTVRLPFDPLTGEALPEVWQRWLAWDPVRLARARPAAAAGLRAVWIDSGQSDEYFLDLGAEAFRRALLAAGLPPERLRFELFEGKHGGIGYRYPLALRFLAHRLQPE